MIQGEIFMYELTFLGILTKEKKRKSKTRIHTQCVCMHVCSTKLKTGLCTSPDLLSYCI